MFTKRVCWEFLSIMLTKWFTEMFAKMFTERFPKMMDVSKVVFEDDRDFMPTLLRCPLKYVLWIML